MEVVSSHCRYIRWQIAYSLACLFAASLSAIVSGCRSTSTSTSGSMFADTLAGDTETRSANLQELRTMQNGLDEKSMLGVSTGELVSGGCGICSEWPGMITGKPWSFRTVQFGPVGMRIISGELPNDSEEFVACIVQTDGGHDVQVETGGSLPLRSCDYALLVAEAWASGTTALKYSFGDCSAYEVRDELRRLAARSLFGIEIELPEEPYRYFDEDGEDVTELITSFRPETPLSFPGEGY